jgi:hypothetical protein
MVRGGVGLGLVWLVGCWVGWCGWVGWVVVFVETIFFLF